MPTLDNYSLRNYGLGGSSFKFTPGLFMLINLQGTQFLQYQAATKKCVTFTVNYAGTYTVVFSLTSPNSTATANGLIYVNGNPVGTHRSTSVTQVTFAEDITVNAGDKIELMLWLTGTINGTNYASLYNPIIRCQELVSWALN